MAAITNHAALSLRVNDLFGAYIATEEEQRRLGEAGHDEEADALSERARSLSSQIHDIRDRTGNADLIVSRLLLELMLTNQWQKVVPGYEWLDWDQHSMLLPIIEALADRTTGVVRVHAAKALATIGVEVVVETADPARADLITFAVNAADLKGFTMKELESAREGVVVVADVLSGLLCQPRYKARLPHSMNAAGDVLDLLCMLATQVADSIEDEVAARADGLTPQDAELRAYLLLRAIAERAHNEGPGPSVGALASLIEGRA